jgi:hypothetical protein
VRRFEFSEGSALVSLHAASRLSSQKAGLAVCASAFAEFEKRLASARVDGNWDAAAAAWIDAAIRLQVARERL